MKELNKFELDAVTGGFFDVSIVTNAVSGVMNTTFNMSQGALLGTIDGMTTGFFLGGKLGGAGGFIVGGVAQLIGITVGTIAGGLGGFAMGAATGGDNVRAWMADFRNTFGRGEGGNAHGGTLG